VEERRGEETRVHQNNSVVPFIKKDHMMRWQETVAGRGWREKGAGKTSENNKKREHSGMSSPSGQIVYA
jgi:hypothetical protein